MVILFVWTTTTSSWSQPAALPVGPQIAFIPIQADYLQVDNLDNAYLLNKQFQLRKYNSKGTLLCTYSSSAYGPLYSVDASNPLNVLLFYKDFNTIVALDNEFSELGTYQLAFRGYTDIGAVGYAQDNNFWVFDNTTLQLKKINAAGNVLAASENLFTIGLNLDERPNFLLSRNNYVYVNAPENGIYTFDINGVYYRQLPFPRLPSFQVRDQQLWFLDTTTQKLVQFYLNRIGQQAYLLPEVGPIKMAKIGRDRLFLLTDKGLHIYPLLD